MQGGGNRIYGLHVIIHNRLFAEYEVIDNFRVFVVQEQGQGLVVRDSEDKDKDCKLVLEDARGQGLSPEDNNTGIMLIAA